ncbi:SMI1/KNR4 family protein [Burkholderia cepacia]|uniref:SMI1/KNR4 family protein n=1 Tax=Burkholderia cepacia TaxID=292 RepID=UPI000F59BB27|nr:SMI1/KNR4 family protein [Burkholderia cepacia]RQT74007.1 SMI1/KNR4 family protein [Burkholderia cepacia]
MMIIKTRKPLSAPTPDDISKVEREIGRSLPSEYVDILKKLNGAYFESNEFDIPGGGSAGVRQFIPFKEITRNIGYMEQTEVSGYFPFAHAEGGNYVCISLRDGDYGCIYFWDHEIPGYEALSKVGNSLIVFLDSLRPFKVEDVYLDPARVKSVWVDPEFLKNLKDD